jgi:hypothetical protein
MESKKDSRQGDGWSEIEPHQKFLELCAISTSGELTEEEQKDLHAHLAECPDCRQALKEFEAAADIGVPLLHSELSGRDSVEPDSLASGAAKEVPASAAQHAESARGQREPVEQSSGLGFSHRYAYRPMELNWNYVWMPFAAAVLLTAALGIYSYQVGRRRNPELTQVISSSPDSRVDALEQQMSDMGHEHEVLKTQLAERDRMIRDLRHQIEDQSAALAAAKSAQANLEQSLQNEQTEKQQVVRERSNFTQQLDAAQNSLQKTQAELDSLRQQRSQDQSRAEILEAQISDLHGQLHDREQTIGKQEELLAHDRDIRDLMGARDLYIAEVFDVARDGATQKPYGRVFYTKGKSLIFYAYDLDQQPGVRNASTFQAWGRGGADKQQALSLGIFYQDNGAKKRWVLKVDDARTLEHIDAVFVTVEPKGGSHSPSSKPLLFASLRIEPNHP